MQLLSEIIKNPSGWDSLGNYIGETGFPGVYVVLCQNRDSDRLTRSNFVSALEDLGNEGKNVEIMRFGHWACGWWEALTVKKNSKEYKIALEIEKNLADYPVLDDSHYYELEHQESSEFWNSLSLSEKIGLCKEYSQSIFSARKNFIPDNCNLEDYLKGE